MLKATYLTSVDTASLQKGQFFIYCGLTYRAKTADVEGFLQALQDAEAAGLQQTHRQMTDQVEKDGL